MNLEELSRELAAREDRPGRSFVMPAPAGPAWEPIAGLLRSALAEQTLSLTNVQFPPVTSAGTITYNGSSSLFPWSGGGRQAQLAVTASFSLDAAGRPQLRIAAPVPASWKLTDSLDGLAETGMADVDWASAAFLLTSETTTDPAHPGRIEPGINLSGEVALSGPFANAGTLLGTPGSRSVSGQVVLGRDSTPMPVLALDSTRPCPAAVGGLAIEAGARLETLYKSFGTVPGVGAIPPAPISFVEIAVRIRIGARTADLRVPLLPGGEPMPMELVGDPVPLVGLEDLAQLAGGVQLEVPSVLPAPTGLALKQLNMPVSLVPANTSGREAVSFDIGLVGTQWDLLPNGILTLEDVGVRTRIDFDLAGGTVIASTIYGTVTLAEELHLVSSVSLPGLDLSVHLDDGRTASVKKLVEQLTGKLTGHSISLPFLDMNLVQLDLAASARTRQFQVATALEADWTLSLGELKALAFEGLALMVEYDGSVLSGWIEAEGTIAGGGVYVSAATAGGPESGWDLAAGLRPGQQIDLVALMKAFMFPDSSTVPGEEQYGLQSLAITVLDLSLSLDKEGSPASFRILAGIGVTWSFHMFGLAAATKLDVAAELDVAGERATSETEWNTKGSLSGSLSIYGLLLQVTYRFAEDNSSLTLAVWYHDRGIEATARRTEVEKGTQHTVVTVTLGDLSLGEILEFLIGLALPGETRRLPSPWDVLYGIDFRNLALTVDLDSDEVSLDYKLDLRLGFASITKIGLIYRSDSGEGKVLMRLTGEILGQPYGTNPSPAPGDPASEPLTWDVIGEQAPPVPGKGAGLIDIRYVGLGQHVALPAADSELKTVEAAIGKLKEAMGPPSGGGSPLGGAQTASLRYDSNSKWLFGLEAELVGTVSLSAVLYDPHLYGALLALKGDRAGALAGLRAELVYRRITDQIGEFSVDLQVPDRFRNWEFGAVSITLGLIHVDVYTNGNFRVDIGFPAGGDFSRAFTVQVFPFIGRGGFYFAYLTGATSERVPAIENGTFDPVIELGVGLTMGVGKEIHKGPLSGGLSLEVMAIFEGVYAPFHPYDTSAPQGTYFWFQGTAEVIGKLYGEVDFAIIKASVSIVARARAVVTMEAHRKTHVELELDVTARASIRILFVTISFHFSMHLDASFDLGEDTTAPWIEGPAQPAPRQQLPQSPRRRLGAAAQPAQPVERAEATAWPPEQVPPARAALLFLPGLTLAGGTAGANAVQVVLSLGAENTISPGAGSAEEVREVATDHLHVVDGDGEPAFQALVKTFLRWAAKAGAGASGTQRITAAQLAAISADLHDPEFVAATFAYSNLEEFFEKSLTFELLGFPAGSEYPSLTSATFLPILPSLAAKATQGSRQETRTYWQEPVIPDGYETNLSAYFEQLATEYMAACATDPLASAGEDETVPEGDGDDEPATLAEAIFGQYFALLTRSAVQTGIDLLAALPYPYPEPEKPSLNGLAAELRQRFGTVTVVVGVARGQSPASVAAEHGLDPEDLAAAYPQGFAAGQATAELEVGPTALRIAEDNQTAPLAAATFTATGLTYQVRARQTLEGLARDADAQPVPAADATTPGPLSGAAIGAENANLTGLLRPGAELAIPSYPYHRMAGGLDTDAFLEVFFAVRNGDVTEVPNITEVPHLDWYEQAIVQMNGGSVDGWGPGTTITVPSGYLKETEPVRYPFHAGDTLARVAATFAVFQAAGRTPEPPTSPDYEVPARKHTITSADTFATVAEAFPGLEEAPLIAANLALDVLNPLAVVKLPPFGVAVKAKQTLADLAATFDLALPDLVKLVKDTPALFLGVDGGKPLPLAIRDLPGAEVEDLVAMVGAKGNEIAAQVSRFLLHGLSLPWPAQPFAALEPEDVRDGGYQGPLAGLYGAIGAQFEWVDPAPSGVPITIDLSAKPGVTWLELYETELVAGKVTPKAKLKPGEALTTTIANAKPFAKYLPAPAFSLRTTSSALPLTAERGVHFQLSSTIHWQAAEHPPLAGTPPSGSPGEPSIWLLPESLRQAAAQGPQPTPAYALCSLSLAAPPEAEGVDLGAYAWAVHVPFTVLRVAAPPPPGADPAAAGWLPSTYLIDSVDEAGEDVLRELTIHLAQNQRTEAETQLALLYPPGPAGESPNGLASGATAAAPPYILKTNLSTETRPRAAAGRATDPPAPQVFSAGLDAPADFTKFLWQGTTVLAGGFYLHYEVDGRGLPDSAFDHSGRATLTLLCMLESQTTPGPEQRGLYGFNTCAVVNDSIDAAATQVYAVQTGGTPPLEAVATVPPGNVGFALDRVNPEPVPEAEPTAEQLSQLLYGMFGYRTLEGGAFGPGNHGLPVAPQGAPADEPAAPWHYEQVIQVSGLATGGRMPQHCLALPPSSSDPYAGISSDATVSVTFEPRDAYGNTAAASGGPGDLTLPVRYTDPVIAVGEWPGATISYAVQPPPAGGKPLLAIAIALQTAGYLPAPGMETAPALRTASAHALRYERILFQLGRPGVTVGATTTLDPASAIAPLPLSRARFAGFAAAAYVFTKQLAGLAPVRVKTRAGDTLTGVAGAFSVTPASLLAANGDLEAAALFAGQVQVPVVARVKAGETIEAFAARVGKKALDLIKDAVNAETPVPAGASVAVARTPVESDGVQSIAEMAAAAGCLPADVGAANSELAGLLADGVRWSIRGVSCVSANSTFKSLVEAFEAAGVKTSAQELAAANAETSHVFNPSRPGAPVSYFVDRYAVPRATTLADLVATKFGDDFSAFLQHNGEATGVIEANAQLEVETRPQAPEPPLSLRAWVERSLGVSFARFALANTGTTVPAFAAGVELTLPALLEPGSLSAVAYALAPGDSLAAVAALSGSDPQALGTSIQDIAGIFVPGAPVVVGSRPPVAAAAEDSLATLLASFPAADTPTMAELVAAVVPSTTLLRPGATIVCAPPLVDANATSLQGMAARLARVQPGEGADAIALGRANAALDGFLDPAAQLTLYGQQWTVGEHGTLTSLYERIAPAGTEFDDFLAAIESLPLLRVGTKTILPPPAATASVPLPAKPAVAATITPLQTEITIARPAEEAAAAGEVTEGSSPVPALCEGHPASYRSFAAALEAAYDGGLKVGVGSALPGSPQKLHAVRLQAPRTTGNAIRSVAIEQTPTFFALPPLCRELISRTVEVRSYESGLSPPLSETALPHAFRAIDTEAWARSALAAIDLALSAPFAASAFGITEAGGTSLPFDTLVEAKKTLATAIAAQLTRVVPSEDPEPDQGAAEASLRQALSVNLTAGWDIAAVVQLPTTVSASFAAADAGGHRLAGKPLPPLRELDGETSLGDLAAAFAVDPGAVATVLGGTPNLLAKGAKLGSWEAPEHATLQEAALALKTSLERLGQTFAAAKPLFADGASVTLGAYSAKVEAEDTLGALADRLATGVAFLGVCNQDVAGLLTGTIYVDGQPHPVDPGTATLATMARSLPGDVTAGQLAELISGQPVLRQDALLHVVEPLPAHSLSASKIDLDARSGHLNLLLGLSEPERYRRLLLPLEFATTGLEYAIEPSEVEPGYETSDWLQFVTPLTEATRPAQIETSLGQVEVPVPLRAYPTPPRLVTQVAAPAAKPPPDPVAAATAWTYTASFETDTAAQDLVELTLGFNWEAVAPENRLAGTTDPFRALAEFAVNQEAIEADLANLLLPAEKLKPGEEPRKKAQSAVAALAEIAAEIASNWGPISPDPPLPPEQSSLRARQELEFTLGIRSRTNEKGDPVLDALVLSRHAGAAWGPEGVLPKLGYVDDAGMLVTIEAEAGSETTDHLEYLPPTSSAPIAAFGRRVFAIVYEGLDALVTQSARMAIRVTRNAALLPGKATEPAFVYRTPETHFSDVAMPALVDDRPIAIGSGKTAGLAVAVEALFTSLLPGTEQQASTAHKLTARFGYRLAPTGDGSEEALPMLSPLVFRPLFAYDSTVPGTLTKAVEEWLEANHPAPGVSAMISLELATFSALLPERQQPLVELTRLDYQLR